MIKRFKRAKFIGCVLAVMTVFTVASWTVSTRVSAVSNATYERLKILTDVLGIIEENYTEEVDPKDLVYDSIKGMVGGLDPHSGFMTPEEYKEMQIDTRGSFGGIGIEIGMRDGLLTIISPIEDTPAFRVGLKAKDRIVKIEDKTTKDMTLSEAVKLMRGPRGTDVTIHVMREGFSKPKPFTITRDIIKVKSVKFKKLEDGFGYVRIVQFQANTSRDLDKALKKLKPGDGELRGLVLDLRNNPGGLLKEAVNVSNRFLSKGIIVSTRGRVKGQDMTFPADESRTQPDYPMIVLVNGGSASASEIVAGALQDQKRAVVLGTTTFGKGSVQTIIPLNDGSAVRITTSKYYTPSGRSIQAKGIEPDIVVGESTKGHIKEKDLKGHLAGEQPEGKAGAADEKKNRKNKKKKKKKKKKERVKIRESVSKDDQGDDLQLERAVEYLKSWYIFKETTGKAG